MQGGIAGALDHSRKDAPCGDDLKDWVSRGETFGGFVP